MGGISTVDLGSWHEIESPAISGKMRKELSIKELNVDLPEPQGKNLWAEQVRLEKYSWFKGQEG